jgi:hypothetical protein
MTGGIPLVPLCAFMALRGYLYSTHFASDDRESMILSNYLQDFTVAQKTTV